LNVSASTNSTGQLHHITEDIFEDACVEYVEDQQPKHGLHSSLDEGLFIIFPKFRTKAVLGKNDVYLEGLPHTAKLDQSMKLSSEILSMSVCRSINQFSEELKLESEKVDNLLATLHQYYTEVKTHWQLNLEVPAGF